MDVGTLIGKTMDVDLLALRRHNVVRILVAIRNPNLFETREVKADAFVILKGYSFRFSKEAADYAAEPDFVPFIWRRNEKDDDARGTEEKDTDKSHLNEPPKSADGDTHMPQANASGPGSSSLGLLGSVAVSHEIAVTPFNENPQTPRGKEIVAQLVSSKCNGTGAVDHVLEEAINASGMQTNHVQVAATGPSSRDNSTSPRENAGLQSAAGPWAAVCSSSPRAVGSPTVAVGPRAGSFSPATVPGTDGPRAATSNPPSGADVQLRVLPGAGEDAGPAGQCQPAASKPDVQLLSATTARQPDATLLHGSPATPVRGSTLGMGSTSPLPSPVLTPTPGVGSTSPLPSPVSTPTLGVGSTSPLPPPVPTPLRRSARHVVAVDGSSAMDEDSMTRAMRRKAEHNLDVNGYLQDYCYTPFVVSVATCGASRPVYGGLYKTGGYGERLFIPTWMTA